MPQLKIDESLLRFKENETRVDGFVNGEGYTSTGGEVVESIPNFITRKEVEINAVDAIAQTLANKNAAAVAAAAAASSATAASSAATIAVQAENNAVAAAAGVSNGGVVGKATKADLEADLAHPSDTVGYVTNDPNPANNGLYRKSGASGSGSWVASSYDRVSVVENRVTATEAKAASNRLSRWVIGDFNIRNNASSTNFKVSFSQTGVGGASVFTVGWSTMRLYDGATSFRRVVDIEHETLSQYECLYIDTTQVYAEPGYTVSKGNSSLLEQTFVDGRNILLIANFYGIPMGLLALPIMQAVTALDLGTPDGKGDAFTRIINAESEINDLNSNRSFTLEIKQNAAYIVTDDSERILYYFDEYGKMYCNSPYIDVSAFETGDECVHKVVDESGAVVSEVDEFGGVSSPGSRLWPVPYISGTELRSSGFDGDNLIAELGSISALNAIPFNDKSIRAVINRAGISATTTVSGAPGKGVLVPDDSRVLHICILYGQSLSVGAQGLPLVGTTNPYPDDALMFGGGPEMDIRLGIQTQASPATVFDPMTATGFQALVAKNGQGTGNRGETVGEALAFELSRMARQIGVQWRSLWIAPGLGGTAYSGLKKGTQPYDNMLAAVQRAKELAAEKGWKAVVDFVYIVHGEADTGNASYYDNLIEWQSDIETDVKAITGQAGDVPFLMSQPSSFFGSFESVKAYLKAHELSDKHFLTTPNYSFGDLYHTDILHFTGPGYHLISETSVSAFRDTLWNGKGWDCLRITAASRIGTIVTLTYNVPVGPLAIDTTQVTERDTKGFKFKDSSGYKTISNVQIIDDGSDGTGIIELTLSSVPNGIGETVEYAMSGHSGERTSATIPRGNIRDSAGETRKSKYNGRRLDNWAVHQIITL